VTLPAFIPGHQVRLLECGKAFFPALLQAIDASTSEVRLETYIFQFDASGERVANALVRAARRGVRVYLVMDGIGSPEVPHAWQQRFAHAGVVWHRFLPLGFFGLLVPTRWRRLHRKLCVVDARVAFCGGINIVDDYWDPVHGTLDIARLDYALRVQGPLVADVYQTMARFWRRLVVTRQIERGEFQDALRDWEAEGAALRAGEALSAGRPAPVRGEGRARAALVLRDNVRNRTRIERAYRKAIGDAHHEVVIANAYFVPGGKLRRALVHAARRGVRVRLLLQGRYEYFMQYHAARPVIAALLDAGVEIFEYRAGFLHAKVAVVDAHWATVGSSNLEPLSLLLAREANVVVEDAAFARELRSRLQQTLEQHCVALDAHTYARSGWVQHLLDWAAYGLMRTLLFVTGRRY